MCLTNNEASAEIKKYQAFEQFQNDLYEYFYENEDLKIEKIEEFAIINFSKIMTKEKLADMLGVSIRTITNKRRSYIKMIEDGQ